MVATELEIILLIVILGMLVGIIYGLRRIFILEKGIKSLDTKLVKILAKKKR